MEKTKSKKSFALKAHTIVFTSFKKEATDDPEAYIRWISTKVDWSMGQLERCPNTQKIHVQGMAWSKDNRSWGFMTPDHVEKCKFPTNHLKYVSKEESRIEGPYEFGIRPTWNVKGQKLTNQEILNTPLTQLVDEGRLHINQLAKTQQNVNLYHIMKKEQVDRRNLNIENMWIQGKPGVGKSHWVREQFPNIYSKEQNKWWDGYKDQEEVLIDDFDFKGKCLDHYLKKWADRYNITGECKFGTVQLTYKKFIITSNFSIEDIWGGPLGCPIMVEAISRRFTVMEFTDRVRGPVKV